MAYLSAMKHAEVSTRLFELLQRLCIHQNQDGSESIMAVSKAFENMGYDRSVLSPNGFEHELAHLQISSHDAKLIFHFLDHQQEGVLMVDNLIDALTTLQALYLPWKAVTAEPKASEEEIRKKAMTAIKKEAAPLTPEKRDKGMGNVLDAVTRKPKDESHAFARPPSGLHAAITSHDLQGDHTPSSSSTSRPNTVQASSCPSACRSAMTVSTAIPADSDSDEERKEAVRPWSSMSGVAAVPKKAEGAAVKTMRAHKKLQMAHASRRKILAGNAADGPSPLPQLDLAVSTALTKDNGPLDEESGLPSRHGIARAAPKAVSGTGRLPQLSTVAKSTREGGKRSAGGRGL